MNGPNSMSPSPTASEIHRISLGKRLGSVLALVVVALATLAMLVGAIFVMRQDFAAGCFSAAIAAACAYLLAYLWRDTRAKWLFRVEFGARDMALRLPANRSLTHRPPAFEGVIAYTDILAIHTRLEAYRSIGMAAMHRAFAIKLRDDTLLLLGEDRAQGTGLAESCVGRLMKTLVARTGIVMTDLGMVEGKGGALMVVGAIPEPWGASSLGQGAQVLLWRRVALTGWLPLLVFLAALAFGGLSGG